MGRVAGCRNGKTFMARIWQTLQSSSSTSDERIPTYRIWIGHRRDGYEILYLCWGGVRADVVLCRGCDENRTHGCRVQGPTRSIGPRCMGGFSNNPRSDVCRCNGLWYPLPTPHTPTPTHTLHHTLTNSRSCSAVAYAVSAFINGKTDKEIREEIGDVVFAQEKHWVEEEKQWTFNRRDPHIVSDCLKSIFVECPDLSDHKQIRLNSKSPSFTN